MLVCYDLLGMNPDFSPRFVKKYVEETRAFILPYAEHVNRDMFRELTDLLESRGRLIPTARRDVAS